jgi:hypothetical protein
MGLCRHQAARSQTSQRKGVMTAGRAFAFLGSASACAYSPENARPRYRLSWRLMPDRLWQVGYTRSELSSSSSVTVAPHCVVAMGSKFVALGTDKTDSHVPLPL